MIPEFMETSSLVGLREQVSRMRTERDEACQERDELRGLLQHAHSETRREAMWARHYQRAARLQAHRTWKQRVKARQAEAAVQRVRDLHAPHEFGHCTGCGISVTHPCDTIRTLDGSPNAAATQPTEETRGWGYCPCGRLLHPEQVTCDKCGEECP